MELIIAEKNNAAERIAEILSGGDFSTNRVGGVNTYEWHDATGERVCVGLAGHVVEVDFTDEYNDWHAVKPSELVEAEIEKNPSKKDIVSAVERLARKADRAVIATDYDSEGELIGKEAYEIIKETADVPIDRVRFSSLTPGEVRGAFEDRDELDFDLAAAGEARQIIDLIWGAALTRYLSLASNRLGDSYLSVGRVQSPTLKILVDREKEIEEFEPDPYWEIDVDLRDGDVFEARHFYKDDGKEQERVWDEETAQAVYERASDAATAEAVEVNTRKRNDYPPKPFDTTQFIRAAGSLGFSASRAMSLAEDLYTAGFISYPRTDNTVYPEDIEVHGVLGILENHDEFAEDASELLELGRAPTSGDKETTDHPPIYPTSLAERDELTEDEWQVYELVVRRFFATLAPPAEWEHVRATFDIAGDTYKANGKRLLDAGYHAYYPYFGTDENRLPELAEGDVLDVEEARLEEKETQPPSRIGQSKLIERMESEGVGTKSTRHNTIDKLYSRGYIESNPPRPTGLARAVVEAMDEYADLVTDPEMTEQLEEDMRRIAEGEATRDEVMEESREMLDRIFEILEEKEDEIADALHEGLMKDRTLGPCPDCEADEPGSLVIRSSRRGDEFVGCDAYPDCEKTYPLPSDGKLVLIDERCDEHGLSHVKVLAGKSTYTHGCPVCKAEEADEEEDIVIGDCPECGDTEGGELAIKQTRRGGRLVGCTRYPDCDYSLPLPRRGDLEITDEVCEEHDLPELVVHQSWSDEPWELGCPICNYESYKAEQEKQKGLRAVDGIGPATEEKLEEAGVETVDELNDADPEELADRLDGVSASRIAKWQSA
ncbi:MAG: DNA topoisomerase I [Halobacteriales archaeon]|nr:DNA topoisomerase I [Halobacteriales archaeon]